MIDRLVDLLIASLRLFQAFVVIADYERGVVLRFGRFHRAIGPGFHWIIPFRCEHVLSTNVVPETMNVGPQSLTTADGQSVTLGTVVTFEIEDAKRFLLEVEGANQVIEDAAYGAQARVVMARTWEGLMQIDLPNELAKAVRKRAKGYGVNVIDVQVSDFTLAQTLRLMMQQAQAPRGFSVEL